MTKLHRGLVMVALILVYAVFSTSALGESALLILPANDVGWSIAELSAPQGVRPALFGTCAPLTGGLMVRYGRAVGSIAVRGLKVIGMINTVGSDWLCDRNDNRHWLQAMYYGFRRLAPVWLVSDRMSLQPQTGRLPCLQSRDAQTFCGAARARMRPGHKQLRLGP